MIAKSMKKKKRRADGRESPPEKDSSRKRLEDRVPKAYRLEIRVESSDDSSVHAQSEDEAQSDNDAPSVSDKSDDDSGLVSDTESVTNDKLDNVQVSSLLNDMEKLKEDLIKRNEYDKLKKKCRRSDSDDD